MAFDLPRGVAAYHDGPAVPRLLGANAGIIRHARQRSRPTIHKRPPRPGAGWRPYMGKPGRLPLAVETAWFGGGGGAPPDLGSRAPPDSPPFQARTRTVQGP